MRALLTTLLFGVSTLIGLPPAYAQSGSAVVLDFSGRGSALARNAVVRGIRVEVDLVSQRDAEAAATNLNVRLATPDGIAAVANELGLTLILVGRVRGNRTEVVIFDSSGQQIDSFRGPRPQGRARQRRLAQAARGAVQRAMASAGPSVSDEGGYDFAGGGDEGGGMDFGGGDESGGGDDMDFGGGDEGGGDDFLGDDFVGEEGGLGDSEDDFGDEEGEAEEEDDEGEEGQAKLPLFSGILGLQGRVRNADVLLIDGFHRQYQSSMYAELMLHLSSFPLRHMDNAARGLTAEVDFAVSLGLSSEEILVDGMGNMTVNNIATTAWRFIVNVGYLYSVLDDLLRVGGFVGFGVDAFVLGPNNTMHSSQYPFLRIGIRGDVKIFGDYFRARLDFAYRKPFALGVISQAFGTNGSANGIDLGLAGYGRIPLGITYEVGFGLTRYGLAFCGTIDPNTVTCVDGSMAADAPAVGGTDTGIRIYIGAGYTFE